MITSITLLLHFLLISFAFANNVCFTDIQLIDSYTKNQNCSDPSHYFLIETQLYIGKGSYTEEEVYFSVPSEFDSFVNLPLNIVNNGQRIASIYDKGNNIFGIKFPNSFSQNTEINFNILTKLSNSTIESIDQQVGENMTFTFRTTTDNVFNSTIRFLNKNVDSLTTNGGYFSNNNTAWFTADIPIALLNTAVTFKSVKTGSNDYKYNINATKLEVVTSVDSLGNPLTADPFTAYTDMSTDDQIEILIDTIISGSGKFVRVHYYTEKLDKTPISNSVSLIQSNSLNKRDLTETVTGTVYGGNNIDTNTNDVVGISSKSTSSLSSTSTGLKTTPLYSNNTYTSTSSPSISTSFSELTFSESALNGITTEILSGLITTVNNSSPATSVPSSSSSSASFFTATTLQNTTAKPTLITSNNIIKTYEIYTITNNAVITEIGSYVAISTIKPTEKASSTTASKIIFLSNSISNSTGQTSTISSTSAVTFTSVVSSSSSSSSSISTSNSTSTSISAVASSSSSSISTSNSTSTFISAAASSSSSSASTCAFFSSSSFSTIQPSASNYLNVTMPTTGISTVIDITTTDDNIKTTKTTTRNKYNLTIGTGAATVDSTSKNTSSVLSISTSNVNLHNLYTTIVNGVAITKTLSGDYALETDLIPISNLSNGNVVNIYKTEVSGSLVTKTMTAINSLYTELFPVTRIRNSTTTVSCSTVVSTTATTKTQSAINSIVTDLTALAMIRNKTTILSGTTQIGDILSTTTIAPVTSIYSNVVPISTLSSESQQQTLATDTAADTLTQSTSTRKTSATIKSSLTSSTTQELKPTSMTTSSIQIQVSQKSNLTHSVISVVPYEAGSNRLSFGVSSFIIILLALLF